MKRSLKVSAAKTLRKRFASLPVPKKEFVDRTEAAKLLGTSVDVVKTAIARGDISVRKRNRKGIATKSGEKVAFISRADFMKLRRKYSNYLTVPEALPIFEQGVGSGFSYNLKNLQHMIKKQGLFSTVGGGQKKISLKDLLRLIKIARTAIEGQTMHQMAEKMGVPFGTLYNRVRKFLPKINAKVFEFNHQLYLPETAVKKLWALSRQESALFTVTQVQLELVKHGLYLDDTVVRDYFHNGKFSGKMSKMDNRRLLFDSKSVKAYIKTQLRKKKERKDFEERTKKLKQKLLPEILQKDRKALTLRDLNTLFFFAKTDERALLHLKEICRPEITKNIYHNFFIRKGPEHNKDLAFSGLYIATIRFKDVFKSRGSFFRYVSLSIFGELMSEYYPKKSKRTKIVSNMGGKTIRDLGLH